MYFDRNLSCPTGNWGVSAIGPAIFDKHIDKGQFECGFDISGIGFRLASGKLDHLWRLRGDSDSDSSQTRASIDEFHFNRDAFVFIRFQPLRSNDLDPDAFRLGRLMQNDAGTTISESESPPWS